MEKTVFTIPNISCGHCVMAIENELKEIPGVVSVKGDADTKQVTVAWQVPATLDGIKKALEGIQYPAI